MDSLLGKKYKLSTSDKFDEFLKALGVGLVTRKMANAVSPVIELTKSGDEYTLTSTSTFKNIVLKFALGQEFDQDTPDGRRVKTVITQEGNKLVEIQKGDKETTIIREFSPEEVKMEMNVENVKATRVYKVVA